MKTLIDETELITQFKQGDHNAFREIYRKYRGLLVIHVNNLVKDQDYALDIVQEIFMWLYENRETVEIKSGSIAAYLYSAVRFKVLNQIAKRKTRIDYVQMMANSTMSYSETHTPDKEYQLKELAAIIESEIDRMPPRMKDIFELSRKHYLSEEQISKALGISKNTVNSQTQKALRRLKKILR